MYILFQFVCVVFLIYILLFTLSCIRFCVCILHEIFTRWLSTLHKLILAHHDEDCGCDCSFCLSCGDFDTLSIGKFMRMMLCPPSLRFHGSSTTLNGRAEDIYIYIYIYLLILANQILCLHLSFNILLIISINFLLLVSVSLIPPVQICTRKY